MTATVGVGRSPFGIAVDERTRAVYVTNISDDTVSVISGRTNTVAATIPVGSKPRGVGVNTLTRTAYVSNFASNTLTVLCIRQPERPVRT